MLNRQRVLLYLLSRAGNTAPKIALMKWCFLVAQETPTGTDSAFYEFVPYLYGPYSFSLHQEVSALMRDGLLIPDGQKNWALTPAGRKSAKTVPANMKSDSDVIWNQYGSLSARKLVESVYTNYPWFTVNSIYENKRAQERPIVPCAVYTAGYEKRAVDGFLNLLLESGIERLIDVRANPISRRYGFHKSTLSHLCSLLSLEYRHFPDLGIPSHLRANLHETKNYQLVFKRYETQTLPTQQKAVRDVADLLAEKPSVLMCQEADPQCCHRLRLANQAAKVSGLPIVNLGWPR